MPGMKALHCSDTLSQHRPWRQQRTSRREQEMVRFLHTADWQLGKPYGRVTDPGKQARLRQARYDAIGRIAGLAAEQQSCFVLIAGDLFDATAPTRSDVSRACSAIGRIPCPVFVIPGNHDHGGPGSLWEEAYFCDEQRSLAKNM
ncbi:MAG: hypothetical protein ERJ68_08845, partial [Aphanocapsa feldmannii 277cI]